MALHGEFRVNATVIGGWSAVRQLPNGWTQKPRPQDEFTYSCTVQLDRTLEGNPPVYWCGDVKHRFGDGALVLAAKTLAAATSNCLTELPDTDDWKWE